ncbi:MAG: DUF2975 domain-containing protein [Ignavibacteriaceae bacterium]|nr:DUF2975 domain-containing protein [Ignavibacteriaceae bacterium]
MTKNGNLSAKTIYSLLSIALGMNIGLLLIIIFMLFSSFFSPGVIRYFSNIPVLINFNNGLGWKMQNGDLINMHGSLKLANSYYGINLLISICQMLILLGSVNCIILLRKIVNTVIAGDPFVPQNGKRLRIISLIIIFLPIIIQLNVWVATKQAISALQYPRWGIRFDFLDNSSLITYIVIGIFVFIVSEVFRIGISLKEEQELTV